MKLVKFENEFGDYIYVNPDRVEFLRDCESKFTYIYACGHVSTVIGNLDEVASKLGETE